jgi:hypothetical protein
LTLTGPAKCYPCSRILPPELVLEEPTPRIFTYAFDAQRVYWMLQVFRPNCRRRCESVHVKSASLHGGQATVLAVLDSLPLQLTVDDTHLYWATTDYPNARLQRILKQGGKVVTLTSELGFVQDLAVDEQFVYVANEAEQGTIARVPK